MALSEDEFREEIRSFVRLVDSWKCVEDEFGIYASLSSALQNGNGEIITKRVHILHNSTYRVPVLWFNLFRRDGSPLEITEVWNELKIDKDTMSRISHNEHPHLGVLYFNIHPCKTMDMLTELKKIPGRYVLQWLSIYGCEIGIKLPAVLLNDLLKTR